MGGAPGLAALPPTFSLRGPLLLVTPREAASAESPAVLDGFLSEVGPGGRQAEEGHPGGEMGSPQAGAGRSVGRLGW
jgi:hypothetical protein